ncbi:prenyltransferase/squalene oxidase repeat-containing protein [Streptomyces sp. NPDC059917]|uniref:prenyltransferase/squalene oxidase repeat-containing protein n=1 Tax=Streptomyces sp. NPDC059917 TaxID=3347002 RepID=UPI003660AA0E
MNVRRCAAALAASAVLCAGAAPAAFAAPSPSPAPVVPSGLFGKGDPTFDGVWRQSFALLAQQAVGVRPAPQAVGWLTGQQCADGAFAAFRADSGAACDAKTVLDTNATAVAVQALKALGGHDAAVKKGADWLKSVQNEDGGWSYNPGAPSEGSSTPLVISALVAAGEKPADVKSKAGKSAYDALLSFQLGCAAEPAADRGAFGYQVQDGKLPANAGASAASVLAGLGAGPVVAPAAADTPAAALECPAGAKDPAAAAQASAGYLAEALKKDGHLVVKTPGAETVTADVGNTADAVIALAAAGHKQSAAGALEWLKANSAEWSKGNPAALATLVLTAHATGTDPKAFGSTDLVTALNATGPSDAPAATPRQSAAADAGPSADSSKSSGSSNVGIWWIIGLGAVAGVGIGFVMSRRKQQP